ncbi:MAG TPA: guanylate kinase [Anaerolineales bacterium]
MHSDLLQRQQQPLLIVISGPSGVGKDSVLQRMKARGLPLHFVVTATTRPRRPEEVEGVDYHFVSHDEFAEMIDNDELLEYAIVYNDYKGIPKEQVRQALASGKDVVMRVDVQGAGTIRDLCPEALLIFLSTRTEGQLVERLMARKTETKEGLKLRIATARQELKQVDLFDYYVINDEHRLEHAVDNILAITTAEHLRTHPRRVTL